MPADTKDYVFVGVVDSALAFLHDHRLESDAIESIVLFYTHTTESCIWRKLFNVLIHKRPDVLRIKVVVHSLFWKQSPWSEKLSSMGKVAGIEKCGKMFCWRGRSRLDYHKHNFLTHLARFPLKRGEKDVTVSLEILGSEESPERSAYLDEWRDAIDVRRTLRTDIAIAEYGVCSADVKEEARGDMTKHAIATRAMCLSKRLGSRCYWGPSHIDYRTVRRRTGDVLLTEKR